MANSTPSRRAAKPAAPVAAPLPEPTTPSAPQATAKRRSPWTIVGIVVGALAVLALVCGGGLVTGFGLGRGAYGLFQPRGANPYGFGMMPGGDWTMPYHRGEMPYGWGQAMPHQFGDEVPYGMMPRLAGAAYLGVTYQEVGPDQAEQEGLQAGEGASVSTVVDGSPAAEAGLQAGDIILAVDGERLVQTALLRRLITAHAPGDQVSLLILRNGAEQTLGVTLGQASDLQIP